MICFVLTFIILFEFSMICKDFRVYISTRKCARQRLAIKQWGRLLETKEWGLMFDSLAVPGRSPSQESSVK